MAGTPYERVLAAELLVVMGVQTADALVGGSVDPKTGKSSGPVLPNPSGYFATIVVFSILAAVAMFGDRTGKLAAQFGGVAALAILIAPTKASKAAGTPTPLIMSVLNYANTLITGGSVGAPHTDTASTGSTTGSASGTLV